MIFILKQSFNYDTMHKLNYLLQYIFENADMNLFKALSSDDIQWVTTSNFRYEILNDAFADVYFYHCQLP